MISEKQHICSFNEWRRCYDVISGNIEYDTFYANDMGVREQVEEFIRIMTDVVCSNSPTVRVNGEAMSRELVSARFLDFTSEDIDCVLDSLKNKSSATANTRNYLITVLYNAYGTKANKYSIMAYNDIREGVISFLNSTQCFLCLSSCLQTTVCSGPRQLPCQVLYLR